MFISWGFTEYCYYYMSSQIQGNHQKWKSRDMESKIYIYSDSREVCTYIHAHTCSPFVPNLEYDRYNTQPSSDRLHQNKTRAERLTSPRSGTRHPNNHYFSWLCTNRMDNFVVLWSTNMDIIHSTATLVNYMLRHVTSHLHPWYTKT